MSQCRICNTTQDATTFDLFNDACFTCCEDLHKKCHQLIADILLPDLRSIIYDFLIAISSRTDFSEIISNQAYLFYRPSYHISRATEKDLCAAVEIQELNFVRMLHNEKTCMTRHKHCILISSDEIRAWFIEHCHCPLRLEVFARYYNILKYHESISHMISLPDKIKMLFFK